MLTKAWDRRHTSAAKSKFSNCSEISQLVSLLPSVAFLISTSIIIRNIIGDKIHPGLTPEITDMGAVIICGA